MSRTSPVKRKKRVRVSPEVLEQRRFARRVRSVFINMGFTHVATEGRESKFGLKVGELDSVFIHQNLLLIVEDTTSAKPFDHAKNKRLLAEQIRSSKKEFVSWLREQFPEHEQLLNAFSPSRFNIFFLYVSQKEMDLDDDEIALLKPMKLINVEALNYFDRLAKTIRHSARTDFWRFLGLNSSDIGPVNASDNGKTIETTIISPDDSTRFSNGVRLVSFMISAEVLLRNAYVLRKDNWGYEIELYQRLIDGTRIKKIRQYVAREGSAFLNNIIVGLPPSVTFQTRDRTPIALDEIQDYGSYRMTLPDEFNSLCIIDGQHRVFAHYEGVDSLEPKVAAIRGKVHLLATGLIFPAEMSELERLTLQSEIFLTINSTSKPVPADVLLAIQSLRAPFADVAIARRVLEVLNRGSTFRGMFQLSQMEDAPIKIASIIKFALRYLVDIDSDAGMFPQWLKMNPGGANLRDKQDISLLRDYISYVASVLDGYFRALKSTHGSNWGASDSKITSTTVINGMIIALRRSLPALGVLDFEGYRALMRTWEVDFAKESFAFVSSQYNRFSSDVLQDMFGLREENGSWRMP